MARFFLRRVLLRQVVRTRTGPVGEDHSISLPETASQRLGLSAAGARGQITQVPGPEFYPLEWTSNGPRSNLEGGLVPGGRSIPLFSSPLSR